MNAVMKLPGYFDEVSKIIDRGGPQKGEYRFLKKVPKEISNATLSEHKEIYDVLSPLLTLDSMLGFTFQKPHGYAGDYELINRIYSKRKSKNKHLRKWDEFYHSLEAAIAVRNRKDYFKSLSLNLEKLNRKSRVLNLGSGPCRDLLEYLTNRNNDNIHFDCLDMDKSAIEFGATVCDNYYQDVTFIHKNVSKFESDHSYDLIWSSGLFDYFKDKIFIRLIRRIYPFLKTGGELVIGNFSSSNPSREVMEVYGQWYLNHRSKETLINLAQSAGMKDEQIEVSQEETGINLFLHIKKI